MSFLMRDRNRPMKSSRERNWEPPKQNPTPPITRRDWLQQRRLPGSMRLLLGKLAETWIQSWFVGLLILQAATQPDTSRKPFVASLNTPSFRTAHCHWLCLAYRRNLLVSDQYKPFPRQCWPNP